MSLADGTPDIVTFSPAGYGAVVGVFLTPGQIYLSLTHHRKEDGCSTVGIDVANTSPGQAFH